MGLRIVALCACLAVLSACADGDAGARAEAVRAARVAVAEPASALGGAVGTLRARTATLADPDLSVAARRDAVAALRTAVADLDETVGRVDGIALDGTTPDVDRATAAVDAAVAAATRLVATAREVVDGATAAVEADEALAAAVATWDQRGSRSEQVRRLGDTADAVAALLDQLRSRPGTGPCAAAVDARLALADAVLAGTEELRELARQGRGTAFDERREELRGSLPAPFGSAAGDLAVCPGAAVALRPHADGVEAALADLQAALNPADLAASRVLGTTVGRS